MLPAGIARAHPFDEAVTYGGYELLTRLAVRFRLGNVPQVLLKYRVHPGQRTRTESGAMRRDRLRFRERLFHDLFPDSLAEDYAAVMRVADGEPFASAAECCRAGEWMNRLASRSSRFQRGRMEERWRLALERAS